MHKLRMLVDSRLGMIHKCECCANYHITLSNVSVSLTHGQVLALTRLITKALKIDCLDNRFNSGTKLNIQ